MRRVGLALAFAVVALLAAYGWATRHEALAPIARPEASAFDRDRVEKGRELAGFGNCRACHTSATGEPFAGGLALPTPFGTIHTTNITPDAATGIGGWTEEAFVRAMRRGIDRAGRHLYPVFPYDHFTRMAEDDLRALYAYLMAEVAPVSSRPPPNALPFPFNLRFGLAFWNLLFLDTAEWRPDPARDQEWNRGAYLAEGIAHCGSCHTPRNAFGALERGRAYDGAIVEGWYAPPLNGRAAKPISWTANALVAYLMDGWHADHGIAAGPMTPVVDNLRERNEDDVFAIAAYVLSLSGAARAADEAARAARDRAARLEWGHAQAPPLPDDTALRAGARLFEARCAECHKAGGRPAPLALAGPVNQKEPHNAAMVVLHGIKPPQGSLGRSMPGFAAQLNDAETVALLRFVRARFGRDPAWDDLESVVRHARTGR